MILTLLLATTLTLKVPSIECAACAKPVSQTLASVPGVSNVRVDWEQRSATIDVGPKFDREMLRKAMLDAGWAVQLPGEKPTPLPPLAPEALKSLDIRSFDGRAPINLKTVTAPGKITVVDYYADWCIPCKEIELRLEHYIVGRKIAIRRVNVDKMDNAAAKQATRDFRLESIPYIRIYDAHGRFVREVRHGNWYELVETLAKLSA